jgi:hypothetical protein
MVGVGGFFIMGGGLIPHTFPQFLGALSVLLAFVNVAGGFVITKRMLDMFKRKYSAHIYYIILTQMQDQLIHPSTHGFMLFLVCCSVVVTLRQRLPVWLVLFKLAT